MAFVEWSDAKFSVGIANVDADHKKLAQYVNDLHAALTAGKANDVLGPLLAKLAAYTQEHFSREEGVWATGKYANLAAHKKEHADLLAKVADFKGKFEAGNAFVTFDVMNFLRDWLINHIQKSDMGAAKAIKA
jgi:hemerythrin